MLLSGYFLVHIAGYGNDAIELRDVAALTFRSSVKLHPLVSVSYDPTRKMNVFLVQKGFNDNGEKECPGPAGEDLHHIVQSWCLELRVEGVFSLSAGMVQHVKTIPLTLCNAEMWDRMIQARYSSL